MENIIIGKHTLESLTSGMYSDPFVIYREYIQNSADSIDEAIETGLLKLHQSKISVDINSSEKRIIISDNGIGINLDSAEHTLINIGNSQKLSNNSRGFRGIGRLSALSYCSRLTFETSSYTEELGTKVTINANRLSKLLSADVKNTISVIDVLKKIYTVETFKEERDSHYLKVTIDGIYDSASITDYKNVKSYIEQNCPVPYSPTDFIWGREIQNRLKIEGLNIQSYNIYLNSGNIKEKIFKPYRDEFYLNKKKSKKDSISDIRTLKITQENKETLAIGWIAKTNYLGSIYDQSIKGIRLRKGNILIGDHRTLNAIFKEPRFNGWTIGELYILDPKLIPNARRDNFEKNEAYYLLMEHLMSIASEISNDIRNASLSRNLELSDALDISQKVVKKVNESYAYGISRTNKGILKKEISKVKNSVSNANISDNTGLYYKEIAFEELDMLIGKVKGSTSFKAINMLPNLNNAEKKVLERVFNTLLNNCGSESDKIIDILIDEFASNEYLQ